MIFEFPSNSRHSIILRILIQIFMIPLILIQIQATLLINSVLTL